MTLPEALNLNFLEEQYDRYKADPNAVSEQWRLFFQGFDLGFVREVAPDPVRCEEAAALVAELVHRYRSLGHLLACMDPLNACPTSHPLLDITAFDLTAQDLERVVATPQFPFAGRMRLSEVLELLRQTYCRSIGVEYMHLQDPAERAWLEARIEPQRNRTHFAPAQQRRILERLVTASIFEQFLNKKYVGVTRFSLEGGEGIIPMLDALLDRLVRTGCREVVLGMAHRGRLNVQANLLGKPVREILAEFEHCYDPTELVGAGDVKYHNGYLGDLDLGDGKSLRVFMANNPSHLEAVNPVVEGIARARQAMLGDAARRMVVPVLLHGDAAFAGQGVVAETLNMSQLAGYSTGGTIHVVINNQIGYTTLPQDARSTRYSTDVAKMLMVPIFHVHGENPEALVHVITLAADYRQTFGKDVVVDVVCYRRFGHNEGDEPYFTQPLMYERIRQRPVLHKLYAAELIEAGVVDAAQAAAMEAAALAPLEAEYDDIHGQACAFPAEEYYPEWDKLHGRFDHALVETGVEASTLVGLARRLNTLPETFTAHHKIRDLLRRRLEAVEKGKGIDWANAEALAFASLLDESVSVRLSGQDCGRGTFSQRHAVVFDRTTGEPAVPLQVVQRNDARFDVYNSLLAEAGVLGFEYGYAVTDPRCLVLWEAQFGDFTNNAQGMIDLFIASGETKWQRLCDLVLLLPHGWEGLGPEHSSARLERFLQLCAEDNLIVCDASTPAQYFHLLRRQAKAPYRKPLIVMTPKSLLRHPRAVSTLDDLAAGGFQPVLDDPSRPAGARRVLICSGKIYYQLLQHREEIQADEVAIVRVEQYYPFPAEQLKSVLAGYAAADTWVWVQEAPENMGGWQFMRPRLEALLGRAPLYAGRRAAASPATGFPNLYKIEQAAISEQAFGTLGGR